MNVFQLSHGWRVLLLIVVFILSTILSACNLNTTPDEQVEPLNTETATPAPSPTFTLTSLPIVPISATPIVDSAPTLIPLTTQSSDQSDDGVVPVGQRGNTTPTANVGSSGGNANSNVSSTTVNHEAGITGTPTIPFPATFSDRYTATVGAERTLLVNYLVELREAGIGSVFFVVRDPNGDEVTRWVITESAEDTEEIPVEIAGEYVILVAFENLRGYYSVDFDTR